MEQYRENVLRDLCWLFNSVSHLPTKEVNDEFEQIRYSALTYGLSSKIGLDLNTDNAEQIQKEIKESILAFEPRIMSETLEVKLSGKISKDQSKSTVIYDIKGELWALPFKEHIYLTTEIDLKTGIVSVKRSSNSFVE